MQDRPRDAAMAEVFRRDPGYAIDLLNDILQEGAIDEAMIVLRQISKAFGGVDAVARQAGLNGKSLARALSAQGKPQVATLAALLRALGLRLAVQPLATANPAQAGAAYN